MDFRIPKTLCKIKCRAMYLGSFSLQVNTKTLPEIFGKGVLTENTNILFLRFINNKNPDG